MNTLQPLSAVSPDAIETLLDLAFGADRLSRTAYAVRAGTEPVGDLSFVTLADGSLAGSLQSWPIRLETPYGQHRPLVMVGPVAVHPGHQNQGIGKHMTRVVTQRLDLAGRSAMMIGDPDYYEPFGFRPGPAGGWTLPGPVEPHRILLRIAGSDDWPAEGRLGPDLLRSGEGLPN
ncbi:GNAT family N-acetyltransferase [Parasphingopyxis algicola]|uniref:GNAT family N-acetyltransferase n=1 Tax=Parasphingopyxis algicola TaxID=2026624 RepID=UPI001FEBB643|nr:N-acetyltransferase [Parasphingopyxis algicola]